MGTPIRQILENYADGMQTGLNFKGLLPGGGSTDFLIESHLDLAMDYNVIGAAGSRMGSDTNTSPRGIPTSGLSLSLFM